LPHEAVAFITINEKMRGAGKAHLMQQAPLSVPILLANS
jgi:hypothetical protein